MHVGTRQPQELVPMTSSQMNEPKFNDGDGVAFMRHSCSMVVIG